MVSILVKTRRCCRTRCRHFTDSNGYPFGIAAMTNLQYTFAGALAGFMFWTGQYIEWEDSDNLAKIVSNGKPVDPAVAVAAFGTPAVFLSGDASTFSTNKGTGGTFTTTGTLTNAATSPSD